MGNDVGRLSFVLVCATGCDAKIAAGDVCACISAKFTLIRVLSIPTHGKLAGKIPGRVL